MKRLVWWAGVVFGVAWLCVQLTPVLAAPEAICVSTAVGGSWTSTGTWQFCSGANPPADGDDVYIVGPVTLAANATAKNVTISSGGGLDTNTNQLNAANLTVDSGGIFTGTLQATGNLQNDGTIVSAGTFTFGGTSVQSIGGTSDITFNNLTIANATGVVLNRDVTVNGALALNIGNLSTGTNTLYLGSGATVGAAGGGDVIGNVRRAHPFTTGTNYVFNNPNTLVNFSTLTSAPTWITFNLAKSVPAGLTRAIPRTYNIVAAGSPSFTTTLQLRYASSEVAPAGVTEANLRAWKQVNGRWTLQAGSVSTGETNPYVTATNVNSFSLWTISDTGAPTAVTLANFAADADGDLKWGVFVFGLSILLMGLGIGVYSHTR